MEIVQNTDETDVLLIKPTSPARAPRSPRSPSRGQTRTASFPYGDEVKRTAPPSSPDPPAYRSSELNLDGSSDPQQSRASILKYRPEGRESEPYASGISPLSMSKTLTRSPDNKSPAQRRREQSIFFGNDEDVRKRSQGSGNRDPNAAELMNTLTADTSDAARKARYRSPSSSSPSRQGGEALEAAMAGRALENLRSSPANTSTSAPTSQSLVSPTTNSQSIPTSQSPSLQESGAWGESDTDDTNGARSSPNTSRQPRSFFGNTPSPKGDDDDDTFEKSKSSSLLSLDVVAEVAKLAKFVQRYELKKEKKAEKKRAKKDSASLGPSVGYDAFTDSQSPFRGPAGSEPSPALLPSSYSNTDSDDFSITDSDSGVSASSNDDDLSVEKVRSQTPEIAKSDRTEKRRNLYIEHAFSDSSEEDMYVEDDVASDSSRLGITPFSMDDEQTEDSFDQNPFSLQQPTQQKIQAMAMGTAPEPRSNPPTRVGATVLSPIPGTPASVNNEFSSMKRSSPTEELTSPVGDESRSPPLKKFKSPRASVGRQRSNSARKRGLAEETQSNPLSARQAHLGRKKTLASLRMREAIIDDSNSDIGSSAALALSIGEESSRNTTGDSTLFSDALKSNNAQSLQTASTGSEFQVRGRQLRNPQQASAPRRRSNSNEGFTKVINMFEDRDTEPFFPKNESWQYMN
uniref:Uncharacterized protein n=1 Tax=Grammatophora oceanica TaxID=210454 RepID=A0A7S1VGX1_9STRA